MNQTFLLLKLRTQVFRNSLKNDFRNNRIKWILLSLLTVIFFLGDFAFFYRILNYMKGIPFEAGEILIPRLLNIIFLTFLSVLLFSNIVASLSTLFFSSDLELLISTPASIRAVFVTKFLQTLVHSSWMLALFGVPILLAYGVVYNAAILYYCSIPFLLLPFLIIPAGIGVTLTMILVLCFPARRAYKIMTVLGLVFGVGIVIYLRFLKPEVLLGKNVPDHLIIQFVENLKVPDHPFVPSNWISQALFFSATGSYGQVLFYFMVLSSAAISLSLLSIFVAEKMYYRGWSESGVIFSEKRVGAARLKKLILRYPLFFLSRSQRALVIKDFTLVLRDPEQWSQFFLLGALVIVYLFNMRSLPLDTFFLKNMVSVLNLGLAGVVLVAVAGRLVFTSTSIEGSCFWIIRSSPLSPADFLWEKFWMNLIPLLAFSETLVMLSNIFLGVDSYIMEVSVITIFLITTGITGLSVGLGAKYPVMKYENINEVVMSSGGLLFMIYSFFYIVLVVSIVSRPVYTHLSGALLQQSFYFFGEKALCYSLIFISSILFTLVPMTKGIQALSDGEQC